MTTELHPLCTLFPRLDGADFDALCADIQANGQREPIVLIDGLVLDGGNRLRACLEVGVEPKFRNFDGDSIVAFVLSANLHRRHLTPGQQAAIVASAQDWANAQPASRPRQECNVAPLSKVADRVAQSGASTRTQKMADKVSRADPELGRQVARGEISLPQALAKVSTPKTTATQEGHIANRKSDEQLDEDGDFDPLAELQLANAENTKLRTLLEADDLGAEALRWVRAYEVAQRRNDEHLSTLASRDKQIAFLARQLERCGKAVGEHDQDKVAAAVEALARAKQGVV
ncbi:MAG: S-adenosylmethionine-binding protein [Pseudomonas sp.]|uniref:hypothetical protein n=1 Tax=Pseudomonas sp. TaxID=306 RepID=UPI00120BCCD1|nr:hypothetical protein [Pseudomonas sp.]RZI75184.1 MAG: S-adenosylmethionine-binding protein [Pseudomonas sp.]